MKKIIIFGGTGDLGKEICKFFYKKGNDIIFTSTSKKKGNKFLKSIYRKEKNNKIISTICNVLDEKSIFKTIKFAYGKFNNIDMAINCMGVFNYDIIKNINYNSLVKCFKINALSIFIINKYFAKNKIKKKYLKIISLGSSSAFDGYKDTISYCGSKHALLGIIRSLNKTLYKKRIINYCLSTGSLKNRMGRKVKNANFEEFIEQKEVIKTISYIYDLDVRGVPQEIFIKRC